MFKFLTQVKHMLFKHVALYVLASPREYKFEKF